MSKRVRIAVDAMSGDLGPRVVISAAENFLSRYPQVDLTLVGNSAELQPQIAKSRWFNRSLQIEHAPDVIAMSDDPAAALRQKKNSSMWVALEYLRSGQADACVSAGNTGALLALSKHLIKTFPSIDRPAICKSVPALEGVTFLLDLGANINCPPEQLWQFARMGVALAESIGIQTPRVALLNIGVEVGKGTDALQHARVLLENDSCINSIGFIESNELFSGKADVIVCDGFHGNIALKASEGVARFISTRIFQTCRRSLGNKLIALVATPLIKQLERELNPATYNGAIFLGLKKIVVKSHGNADEKAFLQSLLVAKQQAELKIPQLISHKFNVKKLDFIE